MFERSLSPDANLVLIGFMGTGKTTVGRLVAARLGRVFVDSDEEIVRHAGMSIPELFGQRGEPGFREAESAVLRELSGRRGLVVATGGGAVTNQESFAALKETGIVVALTASTDVLWDRLRGAGGRPLLSGEDPLQRLKELMSARAPLYARADRLIDTTDLGPDSVADLVVGAYRLSQATHLQVELGERSYPVAIGSGLLPGLGVITRELSSGGKVLLVTNATVGPLYGRLAEEALARAGLDVAAVTLPDGEEFKTLAVVNSVYDAALDHGLGRDGIVIALGGGVVGDTAGFVAATYQRGVRFIQVPTTLLAQVDASIGGKVGVNLPQGKNLVGAFHQPVGVVTDIALLRTLPDREFRAGLAEVVKTAIIADAALFARLEAAGYDELRRNETALVEIVSACCRVKAEVVARDEQEGSLRAVLNLGHTVAHAVESATGFSTYLHGEAVAIGTVTATLLAETRGLCGAGLAERVVRLLASLGLPLTSGVSIEEIIARVPRDKKNRRGRVRWVLPRDLGDVVTDNEVSDDELSSCLEAQARMRL